MLLRSGQEGFEVAVLHRGDESSRGWPNTSRPRAARPDVARQNGLDVCRSCAHGDRDRHGDRRVGDRRLLGLELGADDYICKPFSPRGRRPEEGDPAPREAVGRPPEAGVARQADSREIGCKDLNLTAVEFQFLKVLADHPGRIYTREQLMDAMYRDERVVADRTVDSHIKKIRRKIAAVLPDREVVHSVYGLGYKYEW
jgi:two-component system response regulator BaeR